MVTNPYQTLRTPWAFHFGHTIDGNVANSKLTRTIDPTVFKLNRKPSHKDIKILFIVVVSNWDWNIIKNTILKSVNKIEKNKNAFNSCWMPFIQFNHRYIPCSNLHTSPTIYSKYKCIPLFTRIICAIKLYTWILLATRPLTPLAFSTALIRSFLAVVIYEIYG